MTVLQHKYGPHRDRLHVRDTPTDRLRELEAIWSDISMHSPYRPIADAGGMFQRAAISAVNLRTIRRELSRRAT